MFDIHEATSSGNGDAAAALADIDSIRNNLGETLAGLRASYEASVALATESANGTIAGLVGRLLESGLAIALPVGEFVDIGNGGEEWVHGAWLVAGPVEGVSRFSLVEPEQPPTDDDDLDGYDPSEEGASLVFDGRELALDEVENLTSGDDASRVLPDGVTITYIDPDVWGLVRP